MKQLNARTAIVLSLAWSVAGCVDGDGSDADCEEGKCDSRAVTSQDLDKLLGEYKLTNCERAVEDTLTKESLCDFLTGIEISKGSLGNPDSDVVFVSLNGPSGRVRSEALFATNPGLVDAKVSPGSTFLVASGEWSKKRSTLVWRGVDEVFNQASWTFVMRRDSMVVTYQGDDVLETADDRHVKDVMTLSKTAATQ